MSKLTEARCMLWRAAGKSVMLLAVPFYVIDVVFEWLAKAVSVLCAVAVWPMVEFYDFCVGRHNAARKAETPKGENDDA